MIEARTSLKGVRVLDGFCGSGALGLEALSRGAEFCVFSDIAPALCRENIAHLDAGAQAQILKTDIRKLTGQQAFELILLDPPYGQGLAEEALAHLHENGLIAPDAFIIIEEAKRSNIIAPDFVTLENEKTYGDTQVLLWRYTKMPE